MNEPRPSFDLSRQAWIPCETLSGERVELGFEDVLLRAHELRAIHDASPLATAMLYRLVLATLHRVVEGPEDLDAWQVLWQQPVFEANRVRAYFEKWRQRFDLFDADRPFFQVAGLRDVMFKERDGKDAEPIPASRLAMERSNFGGATQLLEHGGEDIGLTPAQAARAMLSFQGFGPGGRIMNDSGYPKGCPLRVGAVVLAHGRDLRKTLLLNLLVPGPGIPPSEPDDAPAWEQSEPAQRKSRAVRGWLDALTWQARRVELLPSAQEGRVTVKKAVTGAGIEPNADWIEPMFATIVHDEKRGADIVRFDPDKAVWRDATALFRASSANIGERRPAVCSQIAHLVQRNVLKREDRFAIMMFGLSSSQAAITLWRAEELPLPLSLLSDAERLSVVQDGLGVAEEVAKALRASTWILARYTLATGERSPDKKDIGALANRLDARARYFAAVGAHFEKFLEEVGSAPDADSVLRKWKTRVLCAAHKALDDAANQIGTTARAFQARAQAKRHLSIGLAELSASLKPQPTSQGAPA